MELTEINLVVTDLQASHGFYVALGCAFRPVGPDDEGSGTAYLNQRGGPLPVSLHSAEFAAWWDPSSPQPEPGSTTIDVTLDSAEAADALIKAVGEHGGTVIAPTRTMPWGQDYTIIADPDGYRWGLKTPPRPE